MEVKDFRRHEHESKWRMESTHENEISDKDREKIKFDLEIPEKVAGTLACLTGLKTFEQRKECSKEYETYNAFIKSNKVNNCQGKIKVIAHIEGDFGSKTRSQTMYLSQLRGKIKRHLDWLNCEVLVQNKDTLACDMYVVREKAD